MQTMAMDGTNIDFVNVWTFGTPRTLINQFLDAANSGVCQLLGTSPLLVVLRLITLVHGGIPMGSIDLGRLFYLVVLNFLEMMGFGALVMVPSMETVLGTSFGDMVTMIPVTHPPVQPYT